MQKTTSTSALCGTIATDPSDASGTNAYDLNRWSWSEEIIEAAGLDISLFPEVRSSIDVIGEVTEEAAKTTGLRKGTPVICGGGDGSCAGVRRRLRSPRGHPTIIWGLPHGLP